MTFSALLITTLLTASSPFAATLLVNAHTSLSLDLHAVMEMLALLTTPVSLELVLELTSTVESLLTFVLTELALLELASMFPLPMDFHATTITTVVL